jgi:hypothetical protein
MDPRIPIPTKISWIRNTGVQAAGLQIRIYICLYYWIRSVCEIRIRISNPDKSMPFVTENFGSPTESLIPQPIIPEPLIPEPLLGLNL